VNPKARYVRGNYTELEPSAKRGLRLFIGKAACNECHYGPVLSDDKFHNIGVPSSTDPYVLGNIVAANKGSGIDSPLDQGRANIIFIQFVECLVPNPADARLRSCFIPAASVSSCTWPTS